MSWRAFSVIAFAAAMTAGTAASAAAKTSVVGDALCQPGPTHYSTIQAAVNASIAGDTVLVCPGMYREQVVVGAAITLKGVINGTAGAAIIAVPAAGLVPNVVSATYGAESAQLVLQNYGGLAYVSNLAIDGTGSACPTSVPGGATRTVGIKVMNVGTKYSAGAQVQGVAVRYQSDGCGLGEGIDVENSYVTLDGNEIHDVERNGIVFVGGGGFISNNSMDNIAYFGGVSDTWGISLSGVKNTTVTLNQVSAQRGVQFAAGSTGVTFVGNTIGPFTSTGLYLNGVSGNHVWLNRITASFTNLYVRASSGNDITGNVIRLQSFGIVDENSAGGNSFTYNTLNEGVTCFWQNGTPADTVSSNTFQNCTTTIQKVP